MTQPFVALRANASANASDLGGGLYQTVLTVADDSAVYNGTNVAVGFKFIKAGNGGEMRIYDITSVDSAFTTQVTITIDDVDSNGTPGFGLGAIVQPNSAGQFPVVAGIDAGLQQAITQFNLQFGGGDNIYTADGQLAGARAVDQNGNALDFQDGAQSVAIAAGKVTTTDDIEVTGSGNGIIRTAPNGDRFLETTNNLGVTTSTKL